MESEDGGALKYLQKQTDGENGSEEWKSDRSKKSEAATEQPYRSTVQKQEAVDANNKATNLAKTQPSVEKLENKSRERETAFGEKLHEEKEKSESLLPVIGNPSENETTTKRDSKEYELASHQSPRLGSVSKVAGRKGSGELQDVAVRPVLKFTEKRDVSPELGDPGQSFAQDVETVQKGGAAKNTTTKMENELVQEKEISDVTSSGYALENSKDIPQSGVEPKSTEFKLHGPLCEVPAATVDHHDVLRSEVSEDVNPDAVNGLHNQSMTMGITEKRNGEASLQAGSREIEERRFLEAREEVTGDDSLEALEGNNKKHESLNRLSDPKGTKNSAEKGLNLKCVDVSSRSLEPEANADDMDESHLIGSTMEFLRSPRNDEKSGTEADLDSGKRSSIDRSAKVPTEMMPAYSSQSSVVEETEGHEALEGGKNVLNSVLGSSSRESPRRDFVPQLELNTRNSLKKSCSMEFEGGVTKPVCDAVPDVRQFDGGSDSDLNRRLPGDLTIGDEPEVVRFSNKNEIRGLRGHTSGAWSVESNDDRRSQKQHTQLLNEHTENGSTGPGEELTGDPSAVLERQSPNSKMDNVVRAGNVRFYNRAESGNRKIDFDGDLVSKYMAPLSPPGDIEKKALVFPEEPKQESKTNVISPARPCEIKKQRDKEEKDRATKADSELLQLAGGDTSVDTTSPRQSRNKISTASVDALSKRWKVSESADRDHLKMNIFPSSKKALEKHVAQRTEESNDSDINTEDDTQSEDGCPPRKRHSAVSVGSAMVLSPRVDRGSYMGPWSGSTGRYGFGGRMGQGTGRLATRKQFSQLGKCMTPRGLMSSANDRNFRGSGFLSREASTETDVYHGMDNLGDPEKIALERSCPELLALFRSFSPVKQEEGSPEVDKKRESDENRDDASSFHSKLVLQTQMWGRYILGQLVYEQEKADHLDGVVDELGAEMQGLQRELLVARVQKESTQKKLEDLIKEVELLNKERDELIGKNFFMSQQLSSGGVSQAAQATANTSLRRYVNQLQSDTSLAKDRLDSLQNSVQYYESQLAVTKVRLATVLEDKERVEKLNRYYAKQLRRFDASLVVSLKDRDRIEKLQVGDVVNPVHCRSQNSGHLKAPTVEQLKKRHSSRQHRPTLFQRMQESTRNMLGISGASGGHPVGTPKQSTLQVPKALHASNVDVSQDSVTNEKLHEPRDEHPSNQASVSEVPLENDGLRDVLYINESSANVELANEKDAIEKERRSSGSVDNKSSCLSDSFSPSSAMVASPVSEGAAAALALPQVTDAPKAVEERKATIAADEKVAAQELDSEMVTGTARETGSRNQQESLGKAERCAELSTRTGRKASVNRHSEGRRHKSGWKLSGFHFNPFSSGHTGGGHDVKSNSQRKSTPKPKTLPSGTCPDYRGDESSLGEAESLISRTAPLEKANESSEQVEATQEDEEKKHC